VCSSDLIAYDWTAETIGNPLQELTKYSYTNDGKVGEILEGVASGVGQMLPSVAVTLATGGLGAPAALAQGLGTATFIAGAAGRGTEEAFKEGADFYQGFGYGLLSGAVEGAIEKISGGMADKVFGKGIADGVTKNVIKKITTNKVAQKGLTLLAQAGGEGAEEWVSELINPYLKRMTYDKDATLSTRQERLEAALIGGLTSIAFQGTVGRVGAKSRNIQENLAEINTAEIKENNLWGNGKLTEDIQTKLEQQKSDAYNYISEELKKSSEKSRSNIIKKFGLESKFNADGTLIVKDTTNQVSMPSVDENGQIIKSSSDGVINELASPQNFNKEAYSPTLKGKEETLKFKPTTEELTDSQKVARQEFTRLNKGKVKAQLVFTNELGVDADGNIKDGAYKDGVLYINTKANAAEVIVKHELTHFAEGTKAYNKYASFVLREILNNKLMSERFGNLIEKINETSELYKAVTNNKPVNVQQREILTEVIAQYTSENLFTNEDQLTRLARADRTLFQKIIDWVKDKIAYFNKKKNMSKEEREVLSFLRKAEKLYNKALQDAWGASDVINKIEDKDAKYSLSDNIIDNSKRKSVKLNKDIATWEEIRNKRKDSGIDTKIMDSALEEMYEKRRNYGLPKNQWNISKDSEEFIKRLQDGTEQLETRESRDKYEQILKKSDSFREVKVDDLWVNVIHKNAYAKILKDVENENAKLGISTEFYADAPTRFSKDTNIGGFFDVARKTIYLPTNNNYYDFVEVNRHERIHFLSKLADFKAIEVYKDKVLDSLTEEENKKLYAKYSQLYPFLRNNKVALFEEVAAQVYNGAEELSNLKAQDSAKEELNNEIKKKFGLSEIKYSLSKKDSQGNKLTEQQVEFFKDSKVRDENGNLLVVYHGTNNDFTTFDKEKQTNMQYGKGFYFTKNKEQAKLYGDKIVEAYLNGTTNYKDAKRNGTKKDYAYIEDKGYYIVYEPNQIKLINNTNPTNNEDIRYSLKRSDKAFKSVSEIKKYYDKLISEEYQKYKDVDPFGVGRVADNKKAINAFNAYLEKSRVLEQEKTDAINNFVKQNSLEEKSYLGDDIEQEVLEKYGKTFYWSETGYLLTDGSQLDLSGKNEGARGGSRSLDHRDIFGDYEMSGTDAMVEFMSLGNIRVSPETPGIDLVLEPTQEQYVKIKNFVEKMQSQEFFNIDFSDEKGNVIDSIEYDYRVPSSKVLSDIKYYFNNGKVPTQSDLNKFRYSLSKEQVNKIIANKTKLKSYTKQDAEIIINNVLSNYMAFGDKYGDLSNLNKKQAVNNLWDALNTQDEGERAGIALDIANYVIENSVMEDVYADNDNSESIRIINAIKPYLHNIDLKSIKGEIKYKYDKDNSPYAIWGARKGSRGYGADEVGMYLQEEGIHIDAINEADIFFRVDEMYRDAVKSLKKQSKELLKDIAKPEELKKLKNDIAREVLIGFDKQGKETQFGKTIKKYTDKINLLKAQVKDVREKAKATNKLFESIDRIKSLEKYQTTNVKLADEVLGLVKLLKGVKTYRGNISNKVREIMSVYSNEINGQKLYELLSNTGDGINNPMGELIEEIARKRGELTTAEIKSLDAIMQNFIHNVNEYNRVFFEGRAQEDNVLIEQAIKETQEAIKVEDEGVKGAFSRFSRWLTAPIWRFQRLSSYRKNGIMTRMFTEFQNGVSKQARFNMIVAEHYKDFFKKNKKVVNGWSNQEIEIDGTKMSKGQMISLYLLSLRQQAKGHLFNDINGQSGTIRLTNDKVASKGRIKDAINKGQDVIINQNTIEQIKNNLTEVDKEFIKLTQTFFNEIAKNAKYETDMALFGVSNIGDSNDYIPIRVADDQLYKQVGDEQSALSFKSLFSVYSPAFNQDTKPNANNKIVVENIIDIVNRHSKQMSAYYGLAQPVKTFNRLWNKKTENGTKLSIEITKVDSSFEKYVGKLLSDMQGNSQEKTGIDRVIGKVRGWGARAALGLNLKVLANQFVSLPAAAGVGVKYTNLAKGFAMAVARKTDYAKLTEYAPMLYDRFREGNNIDVGLLKEGQGVLGQLDTITNLTTAPIGKIDKFVCGAVWNACLEQTKDSAEYKPYSDEHYKVAAKLTEEAVIKTQANYTALYRPSILREQNSFLQLSTMFMSEPLQQFSLLASSVDKIRVARKLLKSADADTRAEAEALLKQAKTEARHAITAVTVDSILLVLIAQAFKWLKGKEDDDKVKGIIGDFTENFIGMFPFARDIYTLYQGYDITNMGYTGLTNTYNAMKEMYNVIDLLASGNKYDDSEIYGKLRKALLGISQTIGIPLRNLETYTKGIIEKFSPSAIYKYENFFYNQTSSGYSKELTDAISKGDDKLADTILDIMLEEEKVAVKDDNVRKSLKELYEQGFTNVLPKSVDKKITYDGEEITLTNKQYKQFQNVYGGANDNVKTLINSKLYKESTPEVQAKSIKFIYDYYYNLAVEDLLGVELETKTMLFAKAINIEELAIIIQNAKIISADLDKKGNVINGTKKKKIQAYINSLRLTSAQKYMIMGYLGYSNSTGEAKVKSYIQTLKLTKAQKETLFSMSGYEKSKD
jgi:hypothetical protein